MNLQRLDQAYENFITEAEKYYVTKFLRSPVMDKAYKDSLDVVFSLSGTLEKGKGLLNFAPSYGQGKTFFFEVLNHAYRRQYGRNFFVSTDAKELTRVFEKGGRTDLDRYIKCKRLFIDDIGDEGEKKVFKHYSSELNVIRYVILERYKKWISNGWITDATTNLSFDQIAREYGGRSADRLKQMTYKIDYTFLKNGKSFRQSTSTRRYTAEEVGRIEDHLKPTKEAETVDYLKYINELLLDSISFLMSPDWSKWQSIKPYMIERNLIDMRKVSEKHLKSAEIALREELSSKNTRGETNSAKTLKTALNSEDVYRVAESIYIREVFLQLKKDKYVFKEISKK